MDAFLELLKELKNLCKDFVQFIRDWRTRWK